MLLLEDLAGLRVGARVRHMDRASAAEQPGGYVQPSDIHVHLIIVTSAAGQILGVETKLNSACGFRVQASAAVCCG